MDNKTKQQAESNPLEHVFMWVSVDDSLPQEPKKHDQKWADVWADGERSTDVNFFDGEFHNIVEDHQSDFEGHIKIDNVTHWMVVKPPST